MNMTLRCAMVAMAASLICGPALACETWDLDYRHYPQGFPHVVQANGLRVDFMAVQSGAVLSGKAIFYSPTLKANIAGDITGIISANQIRLRVEWSGEYASDCSVFLFNGCTKEYHGVGVYEGSINGDGRAEGQNWDYAHPDSKFGWYVVQPLLCADRPPPPKPIRPIGEIAGSPHSFAPPPNRQLGMIEQKAGSAFLPGSSITMPPSPLTTGTFDTDFGLMELGAAGGVYRQGQGQITVTKTKDNIVRGTWRQSSSARRCPDGGYWGRFVFNFDAGGFTGSYGYCNSAPNVGPWNGKRR